MKSMRSVYAGLVLVGLGLGFNAHADSPTCTGANETKLSWPAVDPVWEMCWVPVNRSVGPQGSGLELRDVHYNGRLVMRRAHAPLLFAEYKDGNGGDCYRDWKNEPANLIANTAVQNRLGVAPFGQLSLAVCDVSLAPTTSYGTCPFGQTMPGGSSCFGGVAIEDLGDEVRLSAQYVADWYMYSSRWTFFKDGRMQPFFGFGNRNGTFNQVTHWHHNYWRMEFDIDNAGNQVVSEDGVDKATEFSALRSLTGGTGGGARTWEVRNPVSGRGYRLVPGAGDYVVPANDSGRGFHPVDFMATMQKTNEYGDSQTNSLFDCQMHENNLINNESIANTRVALYYRVAVRDSTANSWPPGCSGASCIPQDSMICKNAGPMLVPFGDWSDYIHVSGNEGPINGRSP